MPVRVWRTRHHETGLGRRGLPARECSHLAQDHLVVSTAQAVLGLNARSLEGGREALKSGRHRGRGITGTPEPPLLHASTAVLPPETTIQAETAPTAAAGVLHHPRHGRGHAVTWEPQSHAQDTRSSQNDSQI